MAASADPRTSLWLEYAWAVITGNPDTRALLSQPVPAGMAAADEPGPGVDDLELDELAEEAAGELPATAGWFGEGWSPGGALCLEEIDDAANDLEPDLWAGLADASAEWRHAGRSSDADQRWLDATSGRYRSALAAGEWSAGWFGRFWDLAGLDPEATAVAVVGHGPAGLADAAAVALAMRPNLVLTSSPRVAEGLHQHAPDLVTVAFDPVAGSRADGDRHLAFSQWALAASTLLR